MENKVIIQCGDGVTREIILPKFGSLTIQTQDGKIMFIDTNKKERF